MKNTKKISLGLVAIGVGLFGSGVYADPPGDVLAEMRGTWKSTKTAGGPGAVALGDVTITVSGTKMTISDGVGTGVARLKVDASKSPVWIDLIRGTEGKSAEETTKGICEIHGETLKLAWATDGGERPPNFSGEKGVALELVREGSATTQAATSGPATTRP
jgi:uncharacterized protein (TIGR03067 family)